jgi:iron(III) transport system ATP-binding protein
VTARVNGTDVPPTGSIVGLSVIGEARAFEHWARAFEH